MDADAPGPSGQPSLRQAALRGLCPRCGGPTLFDGIASFAPRCRSCDLDYSRFNVGDGPAAFLTLIIGAVVTGMALWLDAAFHPPFWVHILLWVPITAAAVVYGLRVAKAALLHIEYMRNAREAGSRDV